MDLHAGSSGEGARTPLERQPELAWTLVMALGLGIAVVGWADLLLLWFPFGFGNIQWEFGTISAHLDGMPLATIGLSLMAVAAAAQGRRLLGRVLAVVCVAVLLLVLSMSVIYLLNVPIALKGVAPQLRPVLLKGILKAGSFAATYAVLYAWLAWFLWRKTRRPTVR